MSSAFARYSNILSLILLTFSIVHINAYPELLGVVNENWNSQGGIGGPRFNKKARSEDERRLHARQLDLITGLLNDFAPGIFGGGPVWSGDGPFDVWERFPFVPPGPNDQRGPCPAQNALANHGVINHSGVVSIWEVINAVTSVFNMGYDMALLATLSACITGGDPLTLTYSLGGPDSRVEAPLGGLLGLFGQPQGLEHTHNFLEADASLTRDDLYLTGNAWTMNVDLFLQYYNSVPEGNPITPQDLAQAACLRFHQCVETNPNFYSGPGSGYFRSFGLMDMKLWANHTDGSLEGTLTHEIIYSMYGLTNDPAPFTYRPGWERIPENWYRRSEPFDIFGHLEELLDWFGWCPALASIGGNVGAVNSFVGIDFDDPAAGIFNLTDLLEGGNFLCFILQLLKGLSPSFTNNIYATIFGIVGEVTSTLGCPEVPDLVAGGHSFLANLQNTYPGAQKAGSAF